MFGFHWVNRLGCRTLTNDCFLLLVLIPCIRGILAPRCDRDHPPPLRMHGRTANTGAGGGGRRNGDCAKQACERRKWMS